MKKRDDTEALLSDENVQCVTSFVQSHALDTMGIAPIGCLVLTASGRRWSNGGGKSWKVAIPARKRNTQQKQTRKKPRNKQFFKKRFCQPSEPGPKYSVWTSTVSKSLQKQALKEDTITDLWRWSDTGHAAVVVHFWCTRWDFSRKIHLTSFYTENLASTTFPKSCTLYRHNPIHSQVHLKLPKTL